MVKIVARFAEEEAAAAPLPEPQFDACVIRSSAPVDKYQTVAFDGNRYSVPRAFTFQPVSVKGYVDRVAIVAHGQVVATHLRSFQKKTMILDPIHYLAALGRKPGALDHAPVVFVLRCRFRCRGSKSSVGAAPFGGMRLGKEAAR